MPRRSGDWWDRYPSSGPLKVEGGLSTSKQRGAMAGTWWSQRFVDVLESYGLGGRMQRGRRYARTGQVLTLDVTPGVISASVQGSRRTPYDVLVRWPAPTVAQWEAIGSAMTARIGFVAQLLDGEVPPELERVFEGAAVPLFPRRWTDLRADCSCPDLGDPCKHVAAVLYVFADLLDDDPWLLLSWRGRGREDLLGPLQLVTPPDGGVDDEVAPWWPYGAAAFASGVGVAPETFLLDPDRPDAVLDQLDDLDIAVDGGPIVELLRPAYRHLS